MIGVYGINILKWGTPVKFDKKRPKSHIQIFFIFTNYFSFGMALFEEVIIKTVNGAQMS